MIHNNYLYFRDANIIEIGYKLAANDCLFTYHSHGNKYDRLKMFIYLYILIFYHGLLRRFGLETDYDDEYNKNDNKQLTTKQIENWYKNRIYEIEEMTGNAENSLILCSFAVTDKKIKSLQYLLETLMVFHKIIK